MSVEFLEGSKQTQFVYRGVSLFSIFNIYSNSKPFNGEISLLHSRGITFQFWSVYLTFIVVKNMTHSKGWREGEETKYKRFSFKPWKQTFFFGRYCFMPKLTFHK